MLSHPSIRASGVLQDRQSPAAKFQAQSGGMCPDPELFWSMLVVTSFFVSEFHFYSTLAKTPILTPTSIQVLVNVSTFLSSPVLYILRLGLSPDPQEQSGSICDDLEVCWRVLVVRVWLHLYSTRTQLHMIAKIPIPTTTFTQFVHNMSHFFSSSNSTWSSWSLLILVLTFSVNLNPDTHFRKHPVIFSANAAFNSVHTPSYFDSESDSDSDPHLHSDAYSYLDSYWDSDSKSDSDLICFHPSSRRTMPKSTLKTKCNSSQSAKPGMTKAKTTATNPASGSFIISGDKFIYRQREEHKFDGNEQIRNLQRKVAVVEALGKRLLQDSKDIVAAAHKAKEITSKAVECLKGICAITGSMDANIKRLEEDWSSSKNSIFESSKTVEAHSACTGCHSSSFPTLVRTYVHDHNFRGIITDLAPDLDQTLHVITTLDHTSFDQRTFAPAQTLQGQSHLNTLHPSIQTLQFLKVAGSEDSLDYFFKTVTDQVEKRTYGQCTSILLLAWE
ncbi:hypothetical protein BDK51DRAFT_50914 [Blyttiomyces helicus]|uniref:Uncharacterized protein n=1 Tax=Blyttiomyces helicus TaxID=388810 RepID=A0A4P9WM80_9FUNG|nr:hypothetical protein BDK51DRAFT_50914 [Blyttiomyces helicus]|eukprot:RKO93562.1 hypothetical protein BDK51DRAFT_50914 [Blyttiomyces helicus]